MNTSFKQPLGRFVILNSARALAVLSFSCLAWGVFAQVNSGSDGHDGALDLGFGGLPVIIDMADHPDGIYHYTYVNIPAGAQVSFIPNASNTPVVWLVQGECNIGGAVYLNGAQINGGPGAAAGPGGYRGGNAPQAESEAGAGLGPGGGKVTAGERGWVGGNASFAIVGEHIDGQHPSGEVYGTKYLLPLVGGSGGSGGSWGGYRNGGGGGGGAILIASSTRIIVTGSIQANGGGTGDGDSILELGGGAGSGGAIRLVAPTVTGTGNLNAQGGQAGVDSNFGLIPRPRAGSGRIRIDAFSDTFTGGVVGDVTRGFQPIIIPPPNQAVSLSIESVGGIAIAANPTGSLTTPDVVVPANQQTPIPIVIRCGNIALNTEIIVDLKPANGPTIRAVGLNSGGTQASSTAIVSVNMPRGGGTIQATAVSGIAGTPGATLNQSQKYRSYADTGLTTGAERFAKVEVTATLGRAPQIAYLSESGKRYPFPGR